jgi:hypothetical protein
MLSTIDIKYLLEEVESWDELFIFLCDMLLKSIVRNRDRDRDREAGICSVLLILSTY